MREILCPKLLGKNAKLWAMDHALRQDAQIEVGLPQTGMSFLACAFVDGVLVRANLGRRREFVSFMCVLEGGYQSGFLGFIGMPCKDKRQSVCLRVY